MHNKPKETKPRQQYHVKEYQLNPKRKAANKERVSGWIKGNKINIAIIMILICGVMIFFLGDLFLFNAEEAAEPVQVLNEQKPQQDVKVIKTQNEESNEIETLQAPEYLQEYININRNTVGYIRIENTAIDYPVVQTDNNEYYMIHDFYQEESRSGAIFIDFRCDINDFPKTRNIIIYGHRMKDGSMFKDLTKFQDKNFFLENRIIQFDTKSGEYEWNIFAVIETTTSYYYIDTEFPYDEMWIDFLEQANKKSMHETLINFYPEDIVLTLSTCTTEEDGRLVVMAKLIR